MRLNRKIYALLSVIILLFINACSSSRGTGNDDSQSMKNLWNNEVSLDIAEEFVNQLDIKSGLKSKPVFLVGRIDASGADDDIAAGLEYDIELALVNTGNVNFVKNKKTRDHERENRKSMSVFESEDEFYAYLHKLKVDHFIDGKIIADSGKGSDLSYVVELRDLNTGTMDSFEWQKVISR